MRFRCGSAESGLTGFLERDRQPEPQSIEQRFEAPQFGVPVLGEHPVEVLLGDNEGALKAFAWFEREFDEDIGKPDHSLCWSLALYRAGNEIGAAKKLRQAMLSNLYLVPRLLGEPISEIDMWHGSSDAKPEYLDHIPDPYLQLWTDEEKQWAGRLYGSPGFRSVRQRYIEISKLLDSIRPGPERSRLVREMHELERG